jgi:hypothetical protein
MTKREQLFALSGGYFIRKDSKSGVEDVPEAREYFKELAKLNNLQFLEDDKTISVGDRVWIKPYLHKEERCKVIFTPTAYKVFIREHTLHGESHKNVFLTDNGFYTIAFDGTKIEYELKANNE